jgi:hypothetical protein
MSRMKDEANLQMDVVEFLKNKQKLEDFMFFHVKNEDKTGHCYKAKKEGILKGVPDLCFLFPNGYHAFLELKVSAEDKLNIDDMPRGRGGFLRKQQREFLIQANRMGHVSCVSFGFYDAVDKIDFILRFAKKPSLDEIKDMETIISEKQRILDSSIPQFSKYSPGSILWVYDNYNCRRVLKRKTEPGGASIFVF